MPPRPRSSGTGRPPEGSSGGRSGGAGRAGTPPTARTGAAPVRRERRPGAEPFVSRRPKAPALALPPEADPALLDPSIRRQLKVLAQPDLVAGHLVAAGQVIDADPALAYQHTLAAKSMAGRIGAVREAVGIAAYAAGEYAAALAELRAARRISGSAEHLPLLADCERGLGRPDRALALAADPQARTLDRATRVELAIVASGARRDLGQPDAAVLALQGAELDDAEVQEWTPRLWYAYADALLEAGRVEEARQWFEATVTVDDEDSTDALERLEQLR